MGDNKFHKIDIFSNLYGPTTLKNFAKMSITLAAQMKLHSHKLSNSILIIAFSVSSESACDSNKIHEKVAMWHLHFFKNKSLL